MRRVIACLLASMGVVACGSSTTKTVTVPRPAASSTTRQPTAESTTTSATATTSGSSTTNSASAQNQHVISQASQANDNQAQLGADKIRQILTRKLGLNRTEDFDLNHHTPPAEAGDCYVKLGADAVNFEDQSSNILRSPNGRDVVFVQSNTATPLVSCLKQVRDALGW